MTRRAAALLASTVVVVGVLGWLFLTAEHAPSAAGLPEVAAEGDVPLADLVQPAHAEDEPVALPSPPAAAIETAEPKVDEDVVDVPSMLVGFVRPSAGSDAFVSEDGQGPGVAVTDALGVRRMTRAGTDGAFAFGGLPSGPYWLRAGSNDLGWASTPVDVKGETRVDLRLARRPAIQIYVLDEDGNPTENPWGSGLGAAVTFEAPGKWLDKAAAAVGRTETARPVQRAPELLGWLGSIVLDTDPPLHVSLLDYELVLATQRIEVGQEVVRFVLPRGTRPPTGGLKFRLVDDATSEPLPRAVAMLGSKVMRMLQCKGGVGEVDSLRPGNYRLTVYGEKYEGLERLVRIQPGIVEDLGDLRLGPAIWIEGAVVDASGPRPSFELNVEPCESDGSRGGRYGSILSFKTEQDGSFRNTTLARGLYRLTSAGGGDWAEQSWIVDLRAGPLENLRFEVARGVPLVVRPSNGFRGGLVYRVRDSADRIVASRMMQTPEVERVLLAPGRYELEVIPQPGSEPRRQPLSIGDAPVLLALP